MTDPLAIGRLIRAARLQRYDVDGYCRPCEQCEALVQAGLYRLASLQTSEAADVAVGIAVDPAMEWDGGPSLMMGDAVSRFGPIAVPYLLPHKNSSPAAQRILSCIEQRVPCL